MQKVEYLKQAIVLGRMCRRDKCKVNSFKTPLLKVTVIHESEQVIDALKQFTSYLENELNVLEVDFHVGEKGYAVVELDPDYRKVRDMFSGAEVGKMVKTLQAFCKENNAELVKKLRYEGKIDYKGTEITKEFCNVKLVPTVTEGAAADENGIMVIFDLSQSEQLKYKAVERELFSAVQRLRKAAKLELSDRRNVTVKVETGKEVVEKSLDVVKGKINGDVKVVEGKVESEDDKIEIDDVLFQVSLE